MTQILVIHGPNLNLLGQREPEVYGHHTLQNINDAMLEIANHSNIELECFQSNHEGKIIDKIQMTSAQFIIINPAGYTHTSVAIRDALLARSIPFIEVHLSNPYQREPFRHKSFFSDIAYGIISGLGINSYLLALGAGIDFIINHNEEG